MSDKTNYTVEELKKLMIEFLIKRSRSDEYIQGYLDAQKLSGWLRQSCPEWIRNSAALWYHIPKGGENYKSDD